jgi:hypothetical protein
MTAWTILAPGPSLEIGGVWLEPSKTIAINLAINTMDVPHFEPYWCCIDRPNKVHEVCADAVERLRPTLLTGGRGPRKNESNAKRWRELYPDLEIELIPHYQDSWVMAAMRKSGTRLSIFFAIAYAVSKGATRVDLLGVDCAGVGYIGGENPKGQDKPGAWEPRWVKERRGLGHLAQLAEQHGVEITGIPENCRVPSPNG